jgi:hypothetical protein
VERFHERVGGGVVQLRVQGGGAAARCGHPRGRGGGGRVGGREQGFLGDAPGVAKRLGKVGGHALEQRHNGVALGFRVEHLGEEQTA